MVEAIAPFFIYGGGISGFPSSGNTSDKYVGEAVSAATGVGLRGYGLELSSQWRAVSIQP